VEFKTIFIYKMGFINWTYLIERKLCYRKVNNRGWFLSLICFSTVHCAQ